MKFVNARVFTPDGVFRDGGFGVENGVFCDAGGEIRDLGGATVIPGLIDVHVHGAFGFDAARDGTEGLARALARIGVTSFVPAAAAMPRDALRAFLSRLAAPRHGGARVLGGYVEGLFLSPERAGAQESAYFAAPDDAEALALACHSAVRIVTVAPELAGAGTGIAALATGACVAVGHTACDYAQACAAFDAGARHVTHLFNAMPPLLHREPGVIAAAAERPYVTAELICDGVHVHPAAVRAAFALFPRRIVPVSDCIEAGGMPDGAYTLAGRAVTLRGGRCTLGTGTLAGSAVPLPEMVRRAVAFGVPREDVLWGATALAARVAGADDRVGAIRGGLCADFLVCDEGLRIREVWMNGVCV